MNEFEHFSP